MTVLDIRTADLPAEPVQHCTGRLVRRPAYPPWAITDPAVIAAVETEIAWWSRPWWRRLGPPPPAPVCSRTWVRRHRESTVEPPS